MYFGMAIVDRLSPIHLVASARSGACHMNPRSVSTKIPPGFSERPTAPERVLADRVEDDVVGLAVLA